MNSDEKTLAIITVIGLVIFCICAIIINAYTCRTKAKIQGLKWSYGPVQGCMVKERDGKWIDYQRLRYMEN